jgi:hypothetical protein
MVLTITAVEMLAQPAEPLAAHNWAIIEHQRRRVAMISD